MEVFGLLLLLSRLRLDGRRRSVFSQPVRLRRDDFEISAVIVARGGCALVVG